MELGIVISGELCKAGDEHRGAVLLAEIFEAPTRSTSELVFSEP